MKTGLAWYGCGTFAVRRRNIKGAEDSRRIGVAYADCCQKTGMFGTEPYDALAYVLQGKPCLAWALVPSGAAHTTARDDK